MNPPKLISHLLFDGNPFSNTMKLPRNEVGKYDIWPGVNGFVRFPSFFRQGDPGVPSIPTSTILSGFATLTNILFDEERYIIPFAVEEFVFVKFNDQSYPNVVAEYNSAVAPPCENGGTVGFFPTKKNSVPCKLKVMLFVSTQGNTSLIFLNAPLDIFMAVMVAFPVLPMRSIDPLGEIAPVSGLFRRLSVTFLITELFTVLISVMLSDVAPFGPSILNEKPVVPLGEMTILPGSYETLRTFTTL